MMYPIRTAAIAAITALLAAPLFVGCGKEDAGSIRDVQTPDTSKTPDVTVASQNPAPPPPPTSQPAPRQPAKVPPVQTEQPPVRHIPTVRLPKRPDDGWVIFHEAFEPLEDAACSAEWTGDNRLVVETTNIRSLTVDLHKLPSGAPRRGPWNLQIDGQGIEITGYRGKIVDFVRSKNGVWTVDRSRRKMH